MDRLSNSNSRFVIFSPVYLVYSILRTWMDRLWNCKSRFIIFIGYIRFSDMMDRLSNSKSRFLHFVRLLAPVRRFININFHFFRNDGVVIEFQISVRYVSPGL